jgi:carbonic anhydrase
MRAISKILWLSAMILSVSACSNPSEKSTNLKGDTVTASSDTSATAGTQAGNTDIMTKELQDAMSPDTILQKFKDGNQRFLNGTLIHRDYMQQVKQTAGGQHPYAIVVSCVDSRKPAEIIFDKGIGDMFNARVAGNFVNTDILGSIEFACKVSGAKLILVMGHTECGAIKSACDHVVLGNITAMLKNIQPAVDSVRGFQDKRTSKNADFVQAVAKENVLLTEAKILRDSPIIREMVQNHQVRIEGCMYDLQTGRVEFYE